MAINVIPVASGGGIKSVQRGLASSAGSVTITAVDISKSFVKIFGTASTGTVATDSTVAGAGSNASSGRNASNESPGPSSASSSIASRALSAGTNNLVTATAQGYLSNSTTLVVSHACRWEVIEFA